MTDKTNIENSAMKHDSFRKSLSTPKKKKKLPTNNKYYAKGTKIWFKFHSSSKINFYLIIH